MNWLFSFLLTSCMLFGIILRYKPFSPIIKKQKKRILIIHYVVLCILNFFFVECLISHFGIIFIEDYLRFGAIMFAALSTIINILLIPGRVREHIFVFGIVLNANYILMTVPNYLFNHIPRMSATNYLLFLLVSFLILLALIYVPLKSVLCKTITPFLYFENNMKKYWTNVFIIPIAYFVSKYVNLGGVHDTGTVLQLISNFISGIVLILVCISIADDSISITQRNEMGKQLAIQNLYYEELRGKVEHARRERHDFKHHISAIRHFVSTDDKEGMLKYCDNWIIDHNKEASIPYTGNGLVDGIIYQYAVKAIEMNIKFEYIGSVKNNVLSDLDICVLLGNALENAFTACMTIEYGRRVSIIFQNEESLLSIMITNSYDGKIEKDKIGYLSRKRDHEHGIGIKSMESVCKKYNGNLEISHDENQFTLMLLLPIDK